MRAIVAALAALGGGVILAAFVVSSAELLRDLAGEIRRGLDLTWTRVSLQPPGGPVHTAAAGTVAVGTAADGTAAGEPAAVVPIEHRGTALGRIECGPRTDGPLLAEDRRLLAYFAAEAAVGVHNLYLAAELAASRNRIVAGQDAERRRKHLPSRVRIALACLPSNLAIVTFLSQLIFANDTPSGGEFRGRNVLSSPAGWVS
jgi:GAF domain-containing protein